MVNDRQNKKLGSELGKDIDHVPIFQHIFSGSNEAYGQFIPDKNTEAGQKVGGTNSTKKGIVTLEHYIDHLSGKIGLGIIPIDTNSECSFGVIDFDIYERGAISDVLSIIDNMEAPIVPFLSKSGGLHLYIIMNHKVSAADLILRMRILVNQLGFRYIYKKYDKPFSLEIFPKQGKIIKNKDGKSGLGSYINLPYFDKNSQKRALLLHKTPLSFAEAMQYLYSIQDKLTLQGLDDFIKFIPFSYAPPCIQTIESLKPDIEHRNTYLFNVGIMKRKQHPESWQNELHEINAGLKDPLSEAELDNTVINSLSKDSELYSYKCTEHPCVDYCDKEECAKREFGIGKEDGYFSSVEHGALIQYKGTEPYYEWDVRIKGGEYKKFTFNNEADIINQSRFLQMCFRELKLLPNRIKQKEWTNILNSVLQAMTVHEIAAQDEVSKISMIQESLLSFIRDRITTRKRNIEIGSVYYDPKREEYIFMRQPLINHIFSAKALANRVQLQEIGRLFKFFGLKSSKRRVGDKIFYLYAIEGRRIKELNDSSTQEIMEDSFFEETEDNSTTITEELAMVKRKTSSKSTKPLF